MTGPRIESVESDVFDTDYREKTIKLINTAQHEIIAVVGEIAAYRFVDVRWSIEDALDRHCKLRVYANEVKADQHVSTRLIELGAELYLGEGAPERFMVVDRRHWFGRTVTSRAGEIHWDDPDGASGAIKKAEGYFRNGKHVLSSDIEVGKDPLFTMFSNAVRRNPIVVITIPMYMLM